MKLQFFGIVLPLAAHCSSDKQMTFRKLLIINRCKMPAMKPMILMLLLAVTFAAAKDKTRDWQTGMLQDVSIRKHSKLVGHATRSGGYVSAHVHERRDDATYYMIETDDLIYIAKRTLTGKGDKQLKVTIKAPVKFAISGDDFYILDEDGKEHKLSMEEKQAKQKSPPSN